MEAALAAARLGDPIEHTRSLGGFLIGAAIGFAVGIAIVAATVMTGGAALAIVAAAGGAMAATGGMALLGEKLGSTSSYSAGNIVADCDQGIIINDLPAARAIIDQANCSRDGHDPQKIAQGSKTVFFDGYPAARQGDKLQCDGRIADGSPNVIIGADPGTYLDIHGEVPDWMNNLATGLMLVGSAIALGFGAAAAFAAGGLCALAEFGATVVGGLIGGAAGSKIGGVVGRALGGERGEIIGEAVGGAIGGFIGGGLGMRATAGHPVDVATGELFTTETDFRIAGPLPLVWSRVWISSSTHDGALGHGWHHSYDLALRLWPEGGGAMVRLADGRLAFFTLPTPAAPALNIVERLWLETDGEVYRLVDFIGLAHEFGAPLADGLRPLLRVVDPNGNAIRLLRGPAGHLAGIEDSAGRAYAITTDEAGRVLAIDAPHPDLADETLRLVTYRYDAAGDLVAATDARRHAWAYRYDRHLLVEERRRSGFAFHFVWDDVALGRRARCVETWGDEGLFHAKLAYDVEAHTTRVTDGRGAVTHYRWNAIGLIEQRTDPLGAATHREYDEAGHLIQLGQPDGTVFVYRYDALGRLVERVDPAGGVTRLDYALDAAAGVGHGNPARIVGPDGAEHRFRYDARGNLAIQIDPTGRERRLVREARGLPVAVLDGGGVARRLHWSPEGDLVAEGTERAAARRTVYDRLGRPILMRRGDDAPLRLVRDAGGSLIEIHRPDGGVVTLERDAEDRVVRHRDPLGRETRWRYDGLPHPRERITADGGRFRYDYDSELNLVGLENQKGERYRLDYDLAGRLVREIGFDGRTIEHVLDAVGHLVGQRDAGRPLHFRRDPMGRLLEKRFADGAVHRFAWDRGGRLVEAVNETRVLGFSYDAAGRLVAERQDDHVLTHDHDARGRRTETRLPDGRRIRIGWGEDGQVAGVGLDDRTIARFRRDAAGREVERIAGGMHQEQAFDPQGRLVRQEGRRLGGGGALFARSYDYDAADLLTAITDARWGETRYRYDPCDRLLSVEGTEPESFVTDPAGNILASGRDGMFWGGLATGDRLLVHGDRKFEYDAWGNRVAEHRAAGGAVGRIYRYDAGDRLVSVEETSRLGRKASRYGYDALGRRVWKESAETRASANDATAEPAWRRTGFLWNGNVLLAETDEPADPLATLYLHEPASFRPLAQVRRERPGVAATVYHYHLDHLGTPKELTNDNGALVWSARLKAWGGLAQVAVAEIENPVRFQGQYHDAETGLHYNGYRYYSPDEGRFITQDPIRLLGGTNISAYAPNPIEWIDPLGLASAIDALNNQLGDNANAQGVYRFTDNTGKTYVGSTTDQDFSTRLSQHIETGKLPADNINTVNTINMNDASEQEIYNTEASEIVRNGGRSVDGGTTSNVRAPSGTRSLFKDPDWLESEQSQPSRFGSGCSF